MAAAADRQFMDSYIMLYRTPWSVATTVLYIQYEMLRGEGGEYRSRSLWAGCVR